MIDNDAADQRRVPLEGTPNFRDFGGYSTRDGRQVRWGQLYRSGSLSRLTDADLDTLARLGIRAVCDFRHDEERQREPTRWPQALPTQHLHLPLTEGDHSITLKQLLADPAAATVERIAELMAALNRDFVTRHSDTYGTLLRHVLDTPGPVLIHCTAGKDRTGFGAAVILSALGVDEATIMHDYLLTGHFLSMEKEVDRLLARYRLPVSREIGMAVFGVAPEYLRGAFDAVEHEYGDMQNYLREGLRLDAADLRELRTRLLA
jgi:protein-tyrosine phosphatase